jgi:dihydrofolate reductase
MNRAPLALVAILSPNRVIGRAGAMPWHYPEDLKHFRDVTRGHAVLMGRATYASIGRPLPKRRNIVISRDRSLAIEGCEIAHDLVQAIELARRTDAEPRVIGGGQIYAAALPLATRLLLTYTDREYQGDTFFPEIDSAEWREDERRRGDGLSFVTLARIAYP